MKDEENAFVISSVTSLPHNNLFGIRAFSLTLWLTIFEQFFDSSSASKSIWRTKKRKNRTFRALQVNAAHCIAQRNVLHIA